MAWGLLVSGCLAAPWLTRVLLLVEKHLSVRLVDLRGALSDASVALLVIGISGLLVRTQRYWGRALGALVACAFVIATFAMYEFISAFDSLYALSHAGYLADSTFVGGSLGHPRHPLVLLSILGALVVGAAWASVPGGAWWRYWGVALAACVFGQVVVPISHVHDEWRQRQPIYAQLSILPASAGLGSAAVGAEVRDVFRGDLLGERWLGPLGDRPNLMLIMVEAASGAALPSIAAAYGVESSASMPGLDALAQRHIFFTSVVSHQRQTNRGEYGILCGDYPKLLTDQSKMTEQVYGEARRCLPAVLRDAGYATAYIQAAPLGFMLKDQFMKKAGFEELIGDSWFEQSYARTDWGVDDKAFFEQSLRRIVELHESEQPFFATLLTVGTHHPYTFPDSAEAAGEGSRQERAFRWADEALDEFITALERSGVLEDTVVIITSDESAGLVRTSDAAERLLSQSWSFAVVILPEPQIRRVETLYAHVDTALSITDLLGIEAEAARFLGRSWFRHYESPRRLFAGNTYARRVMMWTPDGSAVICDESFRSCTRSSSAGGSMFVAGHTIKAASLRERQILAEAAQLTRSGRSDMTQAGSMALTTAAEVRVPAQDGKKLLTGGQYLRVPGDTTLRVAFDLEIVGDAATVQLHQDVFLNGYSQFERKKIRARAGERWRLSYDIPVVDDSDQLVVQLYAMTVAGKTATIRIHDARLTMIPGASSHPEVQIIRDEVTPTAPR